MECYYPSPHAIAPLGAELGTGEGSGTSLQPAQAPYPGQLDTEGEESLHAATTHHSALRPATHHLLPRPPPASGRLGYTY